MPAREPWTPAAADVARVAAEAAREAVRDALAGQVAEAQAELQAATAERQERIEQGERRWWRR